MQLCHQAAISDYLQYLRTNKTEVQQLFDDLLISVTSFFRDPESWDALQSLVIRPLVEHTDPDEQIRAWVPGCSTGEEAYSLAILFYEEMRAWFSRTLPLCSVKLAAGGTRLPDPPESVPEGRGTGRRRRSHIY